MCLELLGVRPLTLLETFGLLEVTLMGRKVKYPFAIKGVRFGSKNNKAGKHSFVHSYLRRDLAGLEEPIAKWRARGSRRTRRLGEQQRAYAPDAEMRAVVYIER